MFYRKKYYRKGFFLLIFLAGFLLLSAAIMWLWNAIIPGLTGFEQLTYWQAMGLLVLSRILFGGWGPWRRRYRSPRKHWREKWANMSDEDRARFRQAWRKRCRPRNENQESEGE